LWGDSRGCHLGSWFALLEPPRPVTTTGGATQWCHMSDSSAKSPVFLFAGDDPAMHAASRRARETFRYLWRELSWERRRIIPALSLACVKAPFSDDEEITSDSKVEHMWLNDVCFDGRSVSGVLLNAPNWLSSVKVGDDVVVPLDLIGDWMYAISGRVYGAFTVNLIRSRMDEAERAQHDEAWGLDFGDPEAIKLVPDEYDLDAEHPMSVNMGDSMAQFLQEDPSQAQVSDDLGWTMLHSQALAGNLTSVRVLLEHGAKVNAPTHDGRTPLALARSLDWGDVAELLISKGGK
jgi:uncharacterized protein YegJ (DUF2314 family)